MKIIKNEKGKIEVADFDIIQAYKIAVNLENEGIRFYGDILKNINDGIVKEDIKLLLEQEKEHLKFFKTEMDRELKTRSDNFEEDDIVDYMDSGIFSGYKALKGRSDVLKDAFAVLGFGLLIENDSISFYRTLRENTGDSRCVSALDRIINEETKHIERINKLIRYIEKTEREK
ncbi:MAG: ferritin family protein [Candidatus Aureabacteria bacterium]|nr:ferritin family protein [Candidatus Auribacterota bacterium]